MAEEVKLSLLGPFRAERAGARLTGFKSDKVRALLAYLAVERQTAHARDQLAGLLWPTSSRSNALALLRDVLSNLRLVLGDREAETPIVQVERSRLRLNPIALKEQVLWLDVAAFSEALADASTEAELEPAVTLYRGDFLEGFTLADSPDYEAWALLRREVFRRQVMDALYDLTTLRLQRGDYAGAQASARRQLALDTYSEEANRQLMRALVFAGERNQALAHYADYAALLEESLGVAPDVRTTALYRRIRDRRLSADTGSAPGPTTRVPITSASHGRQTPFVGRESELARLEDTWRQVQQGRGQVILVTGAAGTGKTTLVQAFTARLLARANDAVVARGACNAQIGAGDPYLPFREILQLLTGDFDLPGDSGAMLAPAYAQRLERVAPAFVQALAREGPDLIGRLVSLRPQIEGWAGRDLAGRAVPGRTPHSQAALCDQMTRVLRAFGQRSVLTLALDDLQWADSATLNLLAHLGRRLAGGRILIIGAYRPAQVSPGDALSSVVHELQRLHGDILVDLDRAAGRGFVDAFLDREPNTLDEAFRARLAQQTGGNALFTTALLEQMRDDGALVQDDEGRWTAGEDLDWSRLPPRVEAVVARRLQRLTALERELLAVASVEGVSFTAEVVAAVLDRSEGKVERALGALGAPGLHGAGHNLIQPLDLAHPGAHRTADGHPLARYRFRHALFQRYIYSRLDQVQRLRLHEAVGRALERLHADRPDAVAVQLAYHFEEAGLLEPAIDYLLQAGKRAYRLSAPAESAALYRRGLSLVERLPRPEQRDRLEMELLLHLEEPLMATRGWGAPERAASLERAYQLGRELGETTRLLPVLQALASVHIARAKPHAALEAGWRLLRAAEEASQKLYVGAGHRMVGTAHFFLGHCEPAREHLEAGLQAYTAYASEPGSGESGPAADGEVRLRVWLAQVLLLMGYPEQAAVASQEALRLARALGYVGARGIALTAAGAAFHAVARRPQDALRYADELLALADKHGLPSYRGWGRSYRGWATAYQGDLESGLPEMRSGMDELQATGTRGSLPQLFALLAELYGQMGELGEGQAAIDQALELADETGARSQLPEMHRVQGVLHLKRESPEGAEEGFERAIASAREQGTRLFELRTTVNLARLWESQGRAREGEARLSDIYTWFTEGMDTPDLLEARRLLESL